MFTSCGGEDNSDNENTGDEDSSGNISWSDISDSRLHWEEAKTYCKKLGGRLPTISELRTLIQNCPVTETGGECTVTDNCFLYPDCRNSACIGCTEDTFGKYSVLKDKGWLWSSSEALEQYFSAWTVNFEGGYINLSFKHDQRYVRCVY
jgi:hypothetical protein